MRLYRRCLREGRRQRPARGDVDVDVMNPVSTGHRPVDGVALAACELRQRRVERVALVPLKRVSLLGPGALWGRLPEGLGNGEVRRPVAMQAEPALTWPSFYPSSPEH
jgi:hypothetical protein